MNFDALLKGMKRLTEEKFENYKNRIFAEARMLKYYLRGRFIEVGKAYIPDKKEARRTKDQWRHLKKEKLHRRARAKMQKESRRINFQRAA